VVSGLSNNSSGGYAFIGAGQLNQASASHCFVGAGQNNNVSLSHSVICGGRDNVVASQYSACLGGYGGTTRGMQGCEVWASYYFAAVGDAQRRRATQTASTASATQTNMTTDTAAASSINQFVLPNNSAVAFRAMVISRANASGDCAGWVVSGMAKRGATASTVALVGTPTVTALGADTGAASWAVAVGVDTTNGAIQIKVTGAASTNIKWVNDVETVEVVG
jgi:hypothetical protein